MGIHCQKYGHVGSLRALNEVFYQIITLLPTVIRRSVTANIATLRSFGRRSYGYKVPVSCETKL